MSKKLDREVGSSVNLNFDTKSYRFGDLDLKIAANRLPKRDQKILKLHLMGHTQMDIAQFIGGISRSMISRRLRSISEELANMMELKI
jgi:DNA-directed RNA polymerase specialized sigma subunit